MKYSHYYHDWILLGFSTKFSPKGRRRLVQFVVLTGIFLFWTHFEIFITVAIAVSSLEKKVAMSTCQLMSETALFRDDLGYGNCIYLWFSSTTLIRRYFVHQKIELRQNGIRTLYIIPSLEHQSILWPAHALQRLLSIVRNGAGGGGNYWSVFRLTKLFIFQLTLLFRSRVQKYIQ